jgi:hypothetical protein
MHSNSAGHAYFDQLNDPELVIPPGVCLLAYRGSIAHNMYVPNTDPNSIDDIDLMGIVLAPPEHYLGLGQWGTRGTQEHKQGKWDCVYYELRKALELLLQGNPNILSLLWLRPEHYLQYSEAGRDIVDHRQLFVGKHVYHSFAGYASTQLQKMETRDPAELRQYIAVTNELKYRGKHPNHRGEWFERPTITATGADYTVEYAAPQTGEERDTLEWSDDKLLAQLRHYQRKGENIGYMGDKRKQLVLQHGYDAKNAAHCIRLLRMCKEFLATGKLQVYREDAAELLEIKRGQWALERVKRHAEELFSDIKDAYEHSALPAEPDRAGVERLMINILRKHLAIA